VAGLVTPFRQRRRSHTGETVACSAGQARAADQGHRDHQSAAISGINRKRSTLLELARLLARRAARELTSKEK
jgi:hypothetical protein